MKIIDSFIYYNESNILNYRLNLLYNIVDYFIIVEANKTFIGNDKKLYFNENKDLYKKFEDKIIHIIADLPYKKDDINIENGDQWDNEYFQRNSINEGIKKLKLHDNDLILISDLDEIPNPYILENIKLLNLKINLAKLEQEFYYYDLYNKFTEKWYMSKIISYKNYKEYNNNCQNIRFTECVVIPNGGWHLSYFGSPEFIQNKLKNFSHQEYNKSEYIDINNIKNKIENSIDLFNRDNKINKINISDNKYLPKFYNIYLKEFYNESQECLISSIPFEINNGIKAYDSFENMPKKRYDKITNLNKIKNNKIYCFIHSCTLDDYNTYRLDYLIFIINISGLIDILDNIFIYNIGIPINKNYGEKYILYNYSTNPLLYENYTINKLKIFSIENSKDCVLYLHTKGITHDYNNNQINDWINMMLYFLVEKYNICLEKLNNNNDVIGCNFNIKNDEHDNHFSGNFWWAKCNYLKDLPLLNIINPSKYKPEFWLFKNNPNFYIMHNSNINHYDNNYPREKYIIL
jgi:beta-1,4-mannosyl-glycoprotein beta-1,4-N-acetylglucosaminyltransferase